MLSTSREHLQWTVHVSGQCYVVDVAWPGFSNQIAVNGQVVQRWGMPGNNFRTSRTFKIDGVDCRLIRQRTGLVDFTHELRVAASDAVVRQIVPSGAPLASAPRPMLPALLAIILVAMALVLLATLVGISVALFLSGH